MIEEPSGPSHQIPDESFHELPLRLSQEITAGPKSTLIQRFWAFPLTRIVLYLLLCVSILLPFAFTAFALLSLTHHRRGADPVLVNTLIESLCASSCLIAYWVMLRFVEKRPWATTGMTRQGLLQGLATGAAIGAAMLSVGVGTMAALGLYHVTAVRPSLHLLTPLVLYLSVAVFEETLFRGYPFQTMERRWGSGVAVAVTSVLFGLVHLGNGGHGNSLIAWLTGPVFICFEAGLVMSAAYLLTRKLWLPIGIHWTWDYFEGPIYGCADSGHRDPHTLLQAHLTGPAWLTGGAFGPEAGLIFLVVGTVGGVLLLRAAIRQGQWRPMPRRARPTS